MGLRSFVARVLGVTSPLSGRVYVRSQYDRPLTLTPDIVTPSLMAGALSRLTGSGTARDIASIYDLMLATDPHIRGVRRQLKAGVASTPREIEPADDTPEAKRAAEIVSNAVEDPGANFSACLNAIVEAELRGGGLIEIIWTESEPRRWAGFVFVPQQRIRFGVNTGEMRLALTANDTNGWPLSAIPMDDGTTADMRDKFIPVLTDSDIPDFALRGVYRTILSEWFLRLQVGGWEGTAIERFGMPVPISRFGNETDRQTMNAAAASRGAGGDLVISNASDVEFVAAGGAQNGQLVHETYLEASARRISVAFIGSEQTVTVGTDQGSKASAGVHQMVRQDVLASYWALIGDVLRRYAFVPLLRLNGIDPSYAPHIVPQLEKPADTKSTAEGLALLQNIGVPLPLDYVRKITSVPAPGPSESVLTPLSASGPQAPGFSPLKVPSLLTSRLNAASEPDRLKPNGREIVDPIRELIDSVKDDSDLSALRARLDRLPPADPTHLLDSLAALQLDAMARGIEQVRNARTEVPS